MDVRNAPSWHSVVTKPPEGVWFCWQERSFVRLKGCSSVRSRARKMQGEGAAALGRRKVATKCRSSSTFHGPLTTLEKLGRDDRLPRECLRVTVPLAECLSSWTFTPILVLTFLLHNAVKIWSFHISPIFPFFTQPKHSPWVLTCDRMALWWCS